MITAPASTPKEIVGKLQVALNAALALPEIQQQITKLGMIPGAKKLLRGADLSGAEGELKRVEAIIDSMTRAERRNVQLLNASRRKRIARGSGTSVSDVNRLVKQFTQTKKVLKQIGSGQMMPRMPGLPGLPR